MANWTLNRYDLKINIKKIIKRHFCRQITEISGYAFHLKQLYVKKTIEMLNLKPEDFDLQAADFCTILNICTFLETEQEEQINQVLLDQLEWIEDHIKNLDEEKTIALEKKNKIETLMNTVL